MRPSPGSAGSNPVSITGLKLCSSWIFAFILIFLKITFAYCFSQFPRFLATS